MLENEIKNLSAQIAKLNSNFEALFSAANADTNPAKEKPSVEDKAQTNTAETITAQDIKDLCLVKARAVKTNKDKIKAILSEYGARVVDDLKTSDYVEVKQKIGAL